MYDVAFLPESDVVDGVQLGAARLRYRRGGGRQATDAARDLLQRLTTTTMTAPLPPLFPVSTWNLHVAHVHLDSAASPAHHLCSTT